jgi:hypothetical protein
LPQEFSAFVPPPQLAVFVSPPELAVFVSPPELAVFVLPQELAVFVLPHEFSFLAGLSASSDLSVFDGLGRRLIAQPLDLEKRTKGEAPLGRPSGVGLSACSASCQIAAFRDLIPTLTHDDAIVIPRFDRRYPN